MPVIGHTSRRAALVAAGRLIETRELQTWRTVPDASELWDLYRSSGELRFIVQFKANAASRLTYFAGGMDDQTQDPDPDLAIPQAVEAFERVQGPLGEFADFVAELVVHVEVPGEGFLVSYDTDEGEQFAVISSDEFRKAKDGRRLDSGVTLSESSLAARVWRPDPQFSELADSPTRAVRTAAETLIMLGEMTQALTRSRLSAKILGIPDELTSIAQGAEENPDSDPFINSLIDAVVTAVTDNRSAARIAPIIIRGPGEALSQITEIDLTRDMPEWIDKLTEQNIRRLAAGMDAPAEILTGMAEVNHWTAWQIEESAYKQHVDPLVMMILDSLTRAYLWPYLREAQIPEDVVRRQRLWRDYSDLTARTASVESTFGVYDRGGLSEEALRMYTGFNEADAPDETTEQSMTADDLNQRVNAAGTLIRSGFSPEASLAAVGLNPIDHTGLLPVTVKDEKQVEGEGGGAVTEIVDVTTTELPAGPEGSRNPPLVASASPTLAGIDRRLYVAISEASQAALDRALEKAGNRVRSAVRGGGGGTGRPAKHPKFAAVIDGAEGRDITLALGRDNVAALQLSDDDLIPEGTFAALRRRVVGLLTAGQEQVHAEMETILDRPLTPSPQRAGWVERAADFLTAAVTSLALRRLFTPDTKPNPADTGEIGDTHIPAGDVFDTLTIASGGQPSTDPTQPRGLAAGQQTVDWVEEANAQIGAYLWQHGSPPQPFEPHLQLNGTAFESWTSEKLATPPSASWLHTPYMFPGDHRGCSCVAVPIIVPAGE